jgi:hypothetical protein
MRIIGTTGIRLSAHKGRNEPGKPGKTGRALAVVEEPQRAAASGGRLYRLSSAFLAHLALQYDGIAARRRERSERLDIALSSYGTQAQLKTEPAPGPSYNVLT